MPKYYCDYCDTYLTHDSPSVRKTHCGGRKHKENVCIYYQKWLEEQVQKLVDDTTAAFKAGKIQNNPFTQGSAAGGAAIPPPTILAGAVPPVVRPPGAKPQGSLLGGPPGMMPGAPMGPMPGPVGPMMGMPAPVGMMPPGMRPMGPMAGPPMGAPAMPARPMGSALPARMPSK